MGFGNHWRATAQPSAPHSNQERNGKQGVLESAHQCEAVNEGLNSR